MHMYEGHRWCRGLEDQSVFFSGSCSGSVWQGCCVIAAAKWGLVAPGQPGASAEEGIAGRSAGLDILGCPWRCQQRKSPCRPASSGVIGLLENSCHLFSAVHYHFFLSHLWYSDPRGWQVVVLILWQFLFSQEAEYSYFESVSSRYRVT